MGLLDKINKHLNDMAGEIQSKVANATGIAPHTEKTASEDCDAQATRIEELERQLKSSQEENRKLTTQLEQVKAELESTSDTREPSAAVNEIESLKAEIENLKGLVAALREGAKVERQLRKQYEYKVSDLEDKIRQYKKEYFIVDDDD